MLWYYSIDNYIYFFIIENFESRKKKSKIERLEVNSKPLDLTKKSGKTILSFTTWLVNEFFSSSHFDAIKTFKYWFPQNRWFYKQRNFFKMILEFRKDWKDLAFVGRYILLNGRFLQHLPTKVLHLIVALMMSAAQFSSKMLKDLKKQRFCRKV